jgi:hypothetical protein
MTFDDFVMDEDGGCHECKLLRAEIALQRAEVRSLESTQVYVTIVSSETLDYGIETGRVAVSAHSETFLFRRFCFE